MRGRKIKMRGKERGKHGNSVFFWLLIEIMNFFLGFTLELVYKK